MPESRGLYIFDPASMRVRNLRDNAIAVLPDLPNRAELLENWTVAELSRDSNYWTPGSIMFQAEGGIVLGLYKKRPAPAGLVFFHYVDGDAGWTDWTPTVEVTGDAYGSNGIVFDPTKVFPYEGPANPVVAQREIGINQGEAIYVNVSGSDREQVTIEFDFLAESLTGFQGIALIKDPFVGDPASELFYRVAGNANSPYGDTDTALFAGQYTTPGQWGRISATISLDVPIPRWLVLSAIGGQGQTRIRRVSLREALDLGVYFTAAVNYRGGLTWAGTSTMTGEVLIYTFDEGRRLSIRRVSPVIREPRAEGQINTHANHNASAGRLVPHLGNLRLVMGSLSAIGRRDIPGDPAGAQGPARIFNTRVQLDPAQAEVQLDRNRGEVALREVKAVRAEFGISTYLGGISHQGSIFAINNIGQVVRFNDAGGYAKVLFDVPYEIAEFTAGTTATDGPGILDGYHFVKTRPDPLPSYIPAAIRGMGTQAVGFWGNLARLEIVSIPTTGNPVLDAKFATFIGRRGLYTGTDYFTDGEVGSTHHWTVADDGRPLFNYYRDPGTGEWEQLQFPTGTVFRSRYSFAGCFDGRSNAESPVSVRMFEFQGDLYVLWTFGMRQIGGTDPAALPPSMVIKLRYDASTDSVSLLDSLMLAPSGERSSFYQAVTTMDPRNAKVWITYVHGHETAGVTTRDARAIVLDLTTFTLSDVGELYALTTPVDANYDARCVLNTSSVIFADIDRATASVTAVDIDSTAKTATVKFKLTSSDSRNVNALVNVAFAPHDKDTKVGFIKATCGLFNGVNPMVLKADGTEYTFTHNIRADFPGAVAGELQYEILPYDIGSLPEVLHG